jgi:hypothetical protein
MRDGTKALAPDPAAEREQRMLDVLEAIHQATASEAERQAVRDRVSDARVAMAERREGRWKLWGALAAVLAIVGGDNVAAWLGALMRAAF